MKTIPVIRLPCFPDPQIFSKSTVPATRHITEYAVEQERGEPWFTPTAREFSRNFHGGVIRRVEVRDHERGAGKSGRLVNEKMRAPVVTVVGDEKTRWYRGSCEGVLSMESFE